MKDQKSVVRWYVFGLLGASIVVACTSARNQKLGPNALLGNNEPFVEGFIEYPGPRAAWGGPPAVLFHVSAKDGEKPRLWVSPAFLEPGQSMDSRGPASQLASAPSADSNHVASTQNGFTLAMPLDAVRDEFADIVEEFADNDSNLSGCLYPVRIRLVRSGGAVVEREGCRGTGTWTRAASETASRFLNAAGEATRMPASVSPIVTGAVSGAPVDSHPPKDDTHTNPHPAKPSGH